MHDPTSWMLLCLFLSPWLYSWDMSSLKSANGPAQASGLVSGEWELGPWMDLTTETGETFPELTARVLRPWVKTCGIWGLGMLVLGRWERENRKGWLPGTETRTAERTPEQCWLSESWLSSRVWWAPGHLGWSRAGFREDGKCPVMRHSLAFAPQLCPCLCPGQPLSRTNPFFLNLFYASSLPRVHFFIKARNGPGSS